MNEYEQIEEGDYKVHCIEEMIRKVDTNGDGKLNYLDYVNVYNHIQKVKHPESTKKLLTNESYQSYDDMLYILPAGRGTDIFALDDTYKIVKESDNKITFKVATGYIDEKSGKEPSEFADPDYYEYNNFDLEKLDEGWRFTSFPVIR